MPDIGRWGVVDPLAEMYNSMSTYHMSGNNPIFYVDSNGMNYHDYLLNQDGSIELIRNTQDKSDTLYATDKSGNVDKSKSVTVAKSKASDGSIISQLKSPQNSYLASFRTAKEGDVSVGYTNNVNDAVKVFNFLNANTERGTEFGLLLYQSGGSDENYLIATDHAINTMSKSYNFALDKYIKDPISLIAFYHNHDGTTYPDKVTNQWEYDQNTRRTLYKEVLKTTNFLPRYITIHENFGGKMIEINRNGHTWLNTKFTPAGVKSINKIHYDNVK